MSTPPDLAVWLEALGGLHDCTALQMSWSPADCRLMLDIKDLYQNCEGLPEYPGPTRGRVELLGVTDYRSTFDAGATQLWIYDFMAEREAQGYNVRLFTNAGKVSLSCRAAIFPALAFKV